MSKLVAILLLICASHLNIHADSIVTSEESNENEASNVLTPSLEDLYSCADQSSGHIFNVNTSEGFLLWKNSFSDDPTVPTQAVSIWLSNGAEGEGSAFITLTPKSIVYTLAPMKQEPSGFSVAQLRIDLKDVPIKEKYDKEKHYASRHQWGNGFDYLSSLVSKDEVHVIRDQDALSGEQAKKMLELATEKVRRRIQKAPEIVHEFFALRQRVRNGLNDLTKEDVEDLRRGLCGCAHLFPKDTSQAIKELTDRKRPINFLHEDKGSKVRRLEPADLMCFVS